MQLSPHYECNKENRSRINKNSEPGGDSGQTEGENFARDTNVVKPGKG